MLRIRETAIVVAIAIAWSVPTFGRPPGPDQVLRKAEAVRNPELVYAVDFTIHAVSGGTTVSERDAEYSMIASGKNRSVILMRSPDSLYGALMPMADGKYWMLLPKASRPWELSGAQIRNGDVATGDLARINLTQGYKASIAGDDMVDADLCWRLELTADDPAAYYAHIVYWIAKNGFLPRKLEFRGATGTLFKTILYSDYRSGALGLRPMRLTIESLDEWKERGTLTFQHLRPFDRKRWPFTPEAMIALRDAALLSQVKAGTTGVGIEEMLDATTRPK
jgi:hypothetical protein